MGGLFRSRTRFVWLIDLSALGVTRFEDRMTSENSYPANSRTHAKPALAKYHSTDFFDEE